MILLVKVLGDTHVCKPPPPDCGSGAGRPATSNTSVGRMAKESRRPAIIVFGSVLSLTSDTLEMVIEGVLNDQV